MFNKTTFKKRILFVGIPDMAYIGLDGLLMAGVNIPIPDLRIAIHAPSIKDIAHMGESEFFTAVQYLCLEKEMLI